MDANRTQLVTNCGRRLSAGRFRIPSTPCIERVVLRIDDENHDTVWASFTADEAIAVAHALLTQAEKIRQN
ncbi:hypothetical protein [Actinophytocola sp. NPDC049390]|uniref:hypothetical protein n=1 Tax=Actinophytocola sp. NPDC049390 TaxID=3363894 RepID=UPI0037A40261